MASFTSCTSQKRCSGIWASRGPLFSGSDQLSRPILVSTTVGLTELTRILRTPSSRANERVNESRAALVALYAVWPAKLREAAIEETFTMELPLRSLGSST